MLSEVIQSEDALLALKDEWQSLAAATPTSLDLFGGWDHVWQVVHTLKPAKWFVVAVREPEHKRLIAAFAWELLNVHTADKAYRVIQPLASILTPYVEFAVAPRYRRPALQALLDTLAHAGIDVLCLWPMHEASPVFNALTEDMRNSNLLKTFRYPNNVREIETRGLDYASFCRSKSKTTFADARYCERRLKKGGALRFTLSEPLPAAADIVANLSLASAMHFGEEFAYKSKPNWNDWVVEMVKVLANQAIAQVSTLRFNDTIIAGGLSFWHKGRRYFYLTHYDQTYARFSPGKILLYRLIEQTFADQGVFCFGAGNTRYKDQWARSQGELKAAFIFMNPAAQQAFDTIIDRDFIAKLSTA